MKPFTEEQIRSYLEKSKCPYCGSTEADRSSFENSGEEAWATVRCVKCGQRWTEVYEIVSIYPY